MNTPSRAQQVEDACADLITANRPITFNDIAARTSIPRATLYRNPELRAIIDEHRAHERQASTLTGLSIQIEHLRTTLDAIAETVQRHEDELKRLRK